MHINALAREASKYFESRTRDDGSRYVTTRDDTPGWVAELVFDAHGRDMLPDDWRYSTIRDALMHIGDTDAETIGDLEDDAHEFADGAVDVYTGARLEWLGSHLSRPGYCDQAIEDLGGGEQGIVGMIGAGQYTEAGEVFQSVVQSLEARQDALENDDAA